MINACDRIATETRARLDYNHPEKQSAPLNTASTDTRVPPHTWLPFTCRLAIHGHVPAVAEPPLDKRKFSGALPQKTSWGAGGQRVTVSMRAEGISSG